MVRAMRYGLAALVVAMATLGTGWAGGQSTNEVTLKVVKYNELAKMVRALKGKVIVVDFWGIG
jgi:hypothetical protein